MARAQSKLNRVAHIEHEIITGQNEASDWAVLAEGWRTDCMYNHKLQKLECYETSLRRAWYKALNTLMKLRGPAQRAQKPAAEAESGKTDKANPIEESPGSGAAKTPDVQLCAQPPLPADRQPPTVFREDPQ